LRVPFKKVRISAQTEERQYLKDVISDHTTLPIRAWKAERAKLSVEKNGLYQQHYKLKDEVKEIETIKRSIEQITREGRSKGKALDTCI